MNVFRVSVISATVIAIAVVSVGQPEALGGPDNAAVLRECAQGQAKIEDMYRHLQVRGKYMLRNVFMSPAKERHFNFAFASNGASQRYSQDVTKDAFEGSERTIGSSSVSVATADLCFRLRRSPDEATYRTLWLGRRDFDQNCKVVEESLLDDTMKLRCPYKLDGRVPIAALLAHPTFAAKLVTRSEKMGVPVVTIGFEAAPGSGPDDSLRTWRDCGPLTGSFSCIPGLCWAVCDYAFNFRDAYNGDSLEMQGVVRYAAATGPPRPQRIEVYGSSRGKACTVEIWDLTDFEDRPADPSEFTLAAFGLTDAAPPSGGRQHWFWLAAGAMAALLASVLLRALARRRATA
ncbi:MAG: hypothetical protein U0746_22870 [Gemmataceae bacterium]